MRFYKSDGTPLPVTDDRAARRAEHGIFMKEKKKRKRSDGDDGSGGGDNAPPPPATEVVVPEAHPDVDAVVAADEIAVAETALVVAVVSQGSSHGDGGCGGGAPKEQKETEE